jgi:hypothetical protein
MLMLLLAAVLAAPAQSPQSPAVAQHDGLEGVWRFEKEVDTRADGTVVAIGPTKGYAGLLIYTANGHMSATVMPARRPWTISRATEEELRETAESGTAYTGRYEVDTAAHKVTHIVLASMDPGDEGRRLERTYALNGDRLTLSGAWTYHGRSYGFALTFVRVK